MLKLHIANRPDHIQVPLSQEEISHNRLHLSNLVNTSLIVTLTVNPLCMTLHNEGVISLNSCIYLIELWIFIVFILGVLFLPYRLKYYGVNLNNLKQNLVFGIFFGSLFFALSVILKQLILGHPIRWFSNINWALIGVYFINSVTQEIVTKGFFQSYFVAVLSSYRYKKIIAIIMSSIVFAQLHLFVGIKVALLMFFFSILMGIIYERTRSIVGISLIHFLAGIAFFFTGPI